MTSILDPTHPDIICSLTMDNVDNENSLLIDETGNYHGNIIGTPAFTAGAYGNAIDGAISDYVTIADLGSWFSGRTAFGLSFWRNPKNGTGGTQPVFCVSYTSHISPYYVVLIQIQPSFQRYTIGGHNYRVEDSVALSPGYHHFVINYEDGNVEIYRNKILIHAYSVPASLPAAFSNAMLGRIPALNVSSEAAALRDDQLRICDRPFTLLEIEDLYEEPYPYEVKGSIAQDGSPISSQVRIYDVATGALLATTSSDISGAYAKVLADDSPVFVMPVPPSGYSPLVHGPINPVLRS